ncbi:hypothetical protein HMPREF9120_00907 [Neisseria sp. oral taxon 020 str. F0370]|nr:hypothetical protein HMPREF9120_00907 [Neisseria sp. oral taxon 020 str. F0370]
MRFGFQTASDMPFCLPLRLFQTASLGYNPPLCRRRAFFAAAVCRTIKSGLFCSFVAATVFASRTVCFRVRNPLLKTLANSPEAV